VDHLPFPSDADVDLNPPDAAEVELIASGVAAALSDDGASLRPVQHTLMAATFASLTGQSPSFMLTTGDDGRPAMTPLFDALRRRNRAFRERIVQQMVLGALVVQPLEPAVIARVREVSAALGVDETMIDVAAELAAGDAEQAAIDFDRNGYNASFDAERAEVLHTTTLTTAPWQAVPADDALAARWRALELLPDGTLGQAVTRFYRARGFSYPGTEGSVSAQLAQHDWVHVLADYGATIDNELEVFAFIARANDDPRGFSFLAAVVSLFETGVLGSALGLFEPDAGHLQAPGMPERVADAMRRGAECHGSNDFLAIDWFSLSDQPIDDVRARFGLTPKRAAGSPGPFEPGGMTDYQLAAGRAAAAQRGVPYESWGAAPA
jgi:hypothetical protein